MIQGTSSNKHWALDRPITEDNDNLEGQIILDTINFEVDKRKEQVLKRKEGFTNEEFSDEDLNQDQLNFELPKNLGHTYSEIDFRNYFSKTQKWIGHIIEIKESSFTAKLEDLVTSGTHEIGEFDFDEISPGDKELVTIGAIFYWAVGTAMNNGQVEKKSIIRFQRVAEWNEADLNSAEDRAEDLFRNLNWE